MLGGKGRAPSRLRQLPGSVGLDHMRPRLMFEEGG